MTGFLIGVPVGIALGAGGLWIASLLYAAGNDE